MRSGKPLVATDRWTHTQVLTSEMAELVPATPEDFARGIEHLLEDRTKGEMLARNARIFAEREFSDEAYIDAVLSVYRDVFDRPGAQESA